MGKIYIRHAQQISTLFVDPPLKSFDLPSVTEDFDLVITSPYLRCRQTSQILSKGRPIYIDVRISEYLGNKNKIIDFDLNTQPIPPVNETLEEFTHRVDDHFNSIKDLPYRILIVTHSIVVRYLYQKLTGLTLVLHGKDVPFLNGFILEK